LLIYTSIYFAIFPDIKKPATGNTCVATSRNQRLRIALTT